MERRTYADPCGVSRALDAIGERWALLVVRELSLGPRRFGQLRHGLPDVSPNVLSQRLRELEDAGVVHRYDLAEPATGTAYELTERGHALDPVLQALGRWGVAEPEITSRDVSPVSFVRMLRMVVHPDAPDASYGLVVDGEPFRFVISDGTATAVRGRPTDAMVTIAADVPTWQRILDPSDWRAAVANGAVDVDGDRRSAVAMAKLFRVPPR